MSEDRLDRATNNGGTIDTSETAEGIKESYSERDNEVIEIQASGIEVIDVDEIDGFKEDVKAAEKEGRTWGNHITKNHKYTPTAAELKIMEVLAIPGSYKLSKTEICKRADVSRTAFHAAMNKPEFFEYYNDMLVKSVRRMIGDVLQATFDFAIKYPKNHQDRKLLLEMANIHIDKVQHSGDEKAPIRVLFDIPRPPKEE